MFEGNWKCSSCGGAITQLPFEPRNTAGLTCRDCYSKSKGSAPRQSSSAGGDKPKVEGNWQCSGCGGSITSLPFTPRDTSNLKCMDCYKKSKG